MPAPPSSSQKEANAKSMAASKTAASNNNNGPQNSNNPGGKGPTTSSPSSKTPAGGKGPSTSPKGGDSGKGISTPKASGSPTNNPTGISKSSSDAAKVHAATVKALDKSRITQQGISTPTASGSPANNPTKINVKPGDGSLKNSVIQKQAVNNISKLLDTIKAKPQDSSYFGDLNKAPIQNKTYPTVADNKEIQDLKDFLGGPKIGETAKPPVGTNAPQAPVATLDPSMPGQLALTKVPGYGVPAIPQAPGQVVNKILGPRVNLPATPAIDQNTIESLLNGIQSGWAEPDSLVGLLGDYPSDVGQIYGPASLNQYAGVLDNPAAPFGKQDIRADVQDIHPLGNPEKFNYPRTMAQTLTGVDPDALNKMLDAQTTFGDKINVTSGYRNPLHNKKVGGAKKSQHMLGNALDFAIADTTGDDTAKLISALKGAGFSGIGGYRPGKVHADIGPARMWGPDTHASSIKNLPQNMQIAMANAGEPKKKTVVAALKPLVTGGMDAVTALLDKIPLPQGKPQLQAPVPKPKPLPVVQSSVPVPQPKPAQMLSNKATDTWANPAASYSTDEGDLQAQMDAADPFAAPENDLYGKQTIKDKVVDKISDKFHAIGDPVTKLMESIFGPSSQTANSNGDRESRDNSHANRANPEIQTSAGNTDLMTLLAEMNKAGLPQQDQMNLILSVF